MIISSVALWVFSLLSTYSPFENTVRLVWSLLTVAKPREQYKVNSIAAFEMQNVIKIVLYINLETSQRDCFKFVKSLSVVIKNVDHYLSIGGGGGSWGVSDPSSLKGKGQVVWIWPLMWHWCLQENCTSTIFWTVYWIVSLIFHESIYSCL